MLWYGSSSHSSRQPNKAFRLFGVIERAADFQLLPKAMEDEVVTQKTAAIAAAATQAVFKTDLRDSWRKSSGGNDFPLRLADFATDRNSAGRSKEDWVHTHDRAVGVLIGIFLGGAVWAAWAIVATQ